MRTLKQRLALELTGVGLFEVLPNLHICHLMAGGSVSVDHCYFKGDS